MTITAAFVGDRAATGRGEGRRVLIIVQNLPVPFDRRVWQEATELARNSYGVSVICPKGRGYEASYEHIDGIHIYRHPLPFEAKGALGYLIEYPWSLFWEFLLALKISLIRGFDVIHACNPPDTIFLIGGFFKLFGKKFLFDHHDINPELFEAKFGKRGWLYRLVLLMERLTFLTADVSIATNESYRKIAIGRGKMPADRVFVVRSGPSLERMKILPPVPALKKGKQFLVGYVGVMGQQEGIQYLIEAVRHIVYDRKRTDIHFTLVGGGPSLEFYKQLAKEKAVAGYMDFTGRVADEEMLRVLSTADVCVNSDEANAMNDLSTMNKIMEYMALGKPIVQFDLAEGRVSAGEASLYARPNDAIDMAVKILELLGDAPRREAMGLIGRARVENELAWPHEVPKLLAAYDRIFTAQKQTA
ncbi:MAG: glycosyltransferase family 4 protein [Alphaproteobacteria bacterium]|nr:glycosyltransferase family 4 protein [Alphaproteobacteria bacterium]